MAAQMRAATDPCPTLVQAPATFTIETVTTDGYSGMNYKVGTGELSTFGDAKASRWGFGAAIITPGSNGSPSATARGTWAVTAGGRFR